MYFAPVLVLLRFPYMKRAVHHCVLFLEVVEVDCLYFCLFFVCHRLNIILIRLQNYKNFRHHQDSQSKMPLSPPLHGSGIESSQFDKKTRINFNLIVGASLGFAAFIAKRRKNSACARNNTNMSLHAGAHGGAPLQLN